MSNPSQAGRAIVSRLFFGVTSIGAALGLLYLYYNYQRRKDAAASDPNSKRKRRIASGSGESKNRVTFAEQNEIIGFGTTSSSLSSTSGRDEDEDVLVGAVSKAMPLSQANFHNDKKAVGVVLPDLLAKRLSSPEGGKGRFEGTGNVESASPSSSRDVGDVVMDRETAKVEVTEVTRVAAEVAKPAVQDDKVEKVKVAVEEPVIVASNGHSQQGTPAPSSSKDTKEELVTAETDYDQNSMVRHMHIPRDHVSGLIGRKGINIRGIQQTSNTTINFKDETLENGDRVCMIRGRPQDVTLAESMIEKYILEQPIVTTHTMSVPLSSVGRIIGKGGETIRGIQDLSKARVNVDSGINHFRGAGDSTATRTVTIKGTEEQISIARQMVLEKVEEEKSLRRNIDMATQNRTPRRTTSTSSNSPGGSMTHPNNVMNGNSMPLKTNGVLEVFVSCAYHPNDFWIQVMGRESIDLDKLTDAMSEWYSQLMANPDGEEFSVGDIIAAPFDVDGKMYRGKILKILGDDEAEVIYVDYGDKRVLKRTEIQRIHPEFLNLRFQAIQATLNLGCISDRWTDEAISEFCDLTYCAQWQSLTAKVKDYLKDPVDHKDTIWIELIDKDLNIGDELIRRNRARANDSSSSLTAKRSSHSKKSYASVVADEVKSLNPEAAEFHDANGEEVWGEDERNGN